MSRRSVPPAWHEALAFVERGTLLVTGDDDRGRSRCARFVVGQLDRSLSRVALVDGDPRHPEIGVPTCLGLALTGPWDAPAALWFVGDRPAVETAADRLAGVVELARRAREGGAQAVVVDGGPWNPGEPPGFQRALAAALETDQVLLVGREEAALDHLARALEAPGRTQQRLPALPPPSSARNGHGRAGRFEAHFRNARRLLLPLDRLLDPGGRPPETPPPPGSVVGLVGEDGLCLALGWIEAVRPDHVALWTPHPRARDVKRVQTGGPVLDTSTWGTPLGDTPHRLPSPPSTEPDGTTP